MSDAVQRHPPAGAAAQPPATRMWSVIGQLSRARDAYARSTTRDDRSATAAQMARLVGQLRGLADALMDESAGP